jgi:hypothetical protein
VPDDALALAIERCEWERIALYLLIALARATQRLPPATVDDLLAALDDGRFGGDDGARDE